MRLGRQGGWRVVEATLPAAPASTLAIKAPAGQTEIRLSQVPDRRNYDTGKDGQTIDTVLGGGGELALQWRPKVEEGQVDRGLTAIYRRGRRGGGRCAGGVGRGRWSSAATSASSSSSACPRITWSRR